MKYYVVSDVHGFYTELMTVLKDSFSKDAVPHKLIVCGDLMDRGQEALKLQQFILDLMAKDEVILVRGNHEDLFVDMLDKDGGIPFDHHLSNGTYDTALQLTGYDKVTAYAQRAEFVEKVKKTDFYNRIIPSMVNYYETKDYILVHGWIPMVEEHLGSTTHYNYNPEWRNAPMTEWDKARWTNGMAASRSVTEEGKTIVCGHWHCSYGYAVIDGKGSEFGADADFTTYYGKGIIALDACTVHSKKVNCLVLNYVD